MNKLKVIGKRIKAARKAAGLTQIEVAEQSGLSQGTIARIEFGGDTTLLTLMKLRRALAPQITPRNWLLKLLG